MKKIIIAIICVFGAFGGAYAANENAATSKEYVDTELATKQPIIPAQGNNVVMTFDSTAADGIGTKQIYDESTAYDTQQNALVTAATANSAVQMAINGEFICTKYSDTDPTDCWLWTIRSKILLDNVTNTYQTGFDTGINIDSDDFEFEIRVKPSTGSWYILQLRQYTDGPIWGLSGSRNGQTITFNWENYNIKSAIIRNPDKIYYIKATAKEGNLTLYVKNETDDIEDIVTHQYSSFSAPPQKHLGLFTNLADQYAEAGNTVYMVRVKKNGQMVIDYVPATYNDTIGFFDTISQTFISPLTGYLTAGSLEDNSIYLPSN